MALPFPPQAEVPSPDAALPAVFRDVATSLASHPESLRIKKLIFCLCNNAWENDLEILNRVSLEELLSNLIELNSSINSLEDSVYRLANSLNRAELYAIPAEAIVEQLKFFYIAKTLLEPEPELTDRQEGQTFKILLDRVVAELERQDEESRIKKLLLAACKDRWETDLTVLKQYSIRDLVLELYQLKSEVENIEESFTTISQGLNKPEIYQQIAQIILDCVSILYEYRKYKNEDKTDGSIKAGKTPKLPESSVGRSERTEYDIFELRLNILQYANPLRVKLLLFAVLDPDWLEEPEDWSILKDFTLDSLLQQILEAGQDFATLKTQLYKVSALLPDPEENQQVAENLLRIIQPLL